MRPYCSWGQETGAAGAALPRGRGLRLGRPLQPLAAACHFQPLVTATCSRLDGRAQQPEVPWLRTRLWTCRESLAFLFSGTLLRRFSQANPCCCFVYCSSPHAAFYHALEIASASLPSRLSRAFCYVNQPAFREPARVSISIRRGYPGLLPWRVALHGAPAPVMAAMRIGSSGLLPWRACSQIASVCSHGASPCWQGASFRAAGSVEER